jgi:hypothetical protein
LEIEKKRKIIKNWKKQTPKTECHDIKPYPSKDRVMHEGDNPSF